MVIFKSILMKSKNNCLSIKQKKILPKNLIYDLFMA